jgi:hypothetical protein
VAEGSIERRIGRVILVATKTPKMVAALRTLPEMVIAHLIPADAAPPVWQDVYGGAVNPLGRGVIPQIVANIPVWNCIQAPSTIRR